MIQLSVKLFVIEF